MPFAEWTKEFSVGVEEIDDDHKRLLALVNELHDALEAGAAWDVLDSVLDGLMLYVSYHFAHEETLFTRTDYPGYERHRRQHQALTITVQEIQADFQANASETLPYQVLDFLKNWLYEHIMGSDRAFGVYYRAWLARQPPGASPAGASASQ
jgi:hemerythrin